MQIVNVRAEPESAIMVSKEGTRIAISKMTTMVTIRMENLRTPRVEPERPRRDEEGGTFWDERPRRSSIVTTIGRALPVALAVCNGLDNYVKAESILQWNLCQRNDGNEYDDTYRKSLRIAICAEDVRRHFITDFFPKHQETGNGHT